MKNLFILGIILLVISKQVISDTCLENFNKFSTATQSILSKKVESVIALLSESEQIASKVNLLLGSGASPYALSQVKMLEEVNRHLVSDLAQQLKELHLAVHTRSLPDRIGDYSFTRHFLVLDASQKTSLGSFPLLLKLSRYAAVKEIRFDFITTFRRRSLGSYDRENELLIFSAKTLRELLSNSMPPENVWHELAHAYSYSQLKRENFSPLHYTFELSSKTFLSAEGVTGYRNYLQMEEMETFFKGPYWLLKRLNDKSFDADTKKIFESLELAAKKSEEILVWGDRLMAHLESLLKNFDCKAQLRIDQQGEVYIDVDGVRVHTPTKYRREISERLQKEEDLDLSLVDAYLKEQKERVAQYDELSKRYREKNGELLKVLSSRNTLLDLRIKMMNIFKE